MLPIPSAADTVFRPQLSIYCVVLVWINVILWHKHICDDRASHCWLLYMWKKLGLSWDDDLQKFSTGTVCVFFQSASSCDFTLESVLLLKVLQCLGTWASQPQTMEKCIWETRRVLQSFPEVASLARPAWTCRHRKQNLNFPDWIEQKAGDSSKLVCSNVKTPIRGKIIAADTKIWMSRLLFSVLHCSPF